MADDGVVALFGGSGAVGHALAPVLERRGVPYRAVGRATADFFTGEGVAAAAQGVETLFYLAGAPYTEYYKHPIMVRHALDAAQAARVKRFVHIAPVYSYGPATIRPVPESQPHVPKTRKGRFRWEQEEAVLARNGVGIATMVVHLPDFYGPNADLSYANVFLREALAGKTANWIGPLEAEREFVYVPDVAEPLLQLAAMDDAYGRCWNLGGRTIKARAFADDAFAALNAKRKYRSIPKLVLQVAGVVQPFMREVAEMYYLFEGSFVLDDRALTQRLGGIVKTPFEHGLAQTLEWMRA